MIRNPHICAVLAVVSLAGCESQARPKAPEEASLAAEVLRGDRPNGPVGACWATDQTPGVIETVTEQTASGTQDAGYVTQTHQEIVQERVQTWFRTPCDAALTQDVIATLQRALAVRSYYAGEPNGLFDPATRTAIRAYQAARGLNSDRLSLAAARDLGVVAADFGNYPTE